MHCGSVRSVGYVAGVKKLRNVQLFRQRRIPVDQSDHVIQIYAKYIVFNEIAFVIQHMKTHGHVKKPPSVDDRRAQCERGAMRMKHTGLIDRGAFIVA